MAVWFLHACWLCLACTCLSVLVMLPRRRKVSSIREHSLRSYMQKSYVVLSLHYMNRQQFLIGDAFGNCAPRRAWVCNSDDRHKYMACRKLSDSSIHLHTAEVVVSASYGALFKVSGRVGS
jgi:hypothetical protein